MFVELFFKNLPPQPRNATHEKTKFGMRLSDMAVAYQDDIRTRLAKTNKKDCFKECDAVSMTVTIYTPVSHFLTEKKKLSKTSIDLDAHKLFLDELAKYFGFNDGIVWDINYIKLPVDGDEWCFKVDIFGEEATQWDVFNIATLIRNSRGYHILD